MKHSAFCLTKQYFWEKNIEVDIFSVTRRSRSDGSHWVTEWTLADLTDVTLVSDDSYGEDEEGEEDEEDE